MLKKILFLLAITLMSGASFACDKNEPRCKASNELVEILKYKESLSQMQMECRGRATEMDPENVSKVRPAAFLGIMRGTEGWRQLSYVYDMYIDEACGDKELLFLLVAAYRAGWDQALPGGKLNEALEKAKKNGKTELEEESKLVSERINTVMGPILYQMVEYAKSNYEAHIKAVLSGEAIDVVKRGASCRPAQGSPNF